MIFGDNLNINGQRKGGATMSIQWEKEIHKGEKFDQMSMKEFVDPFTGENKIETSLASSKCEALFRCSRERSLLRKPVILVVLFYTKTS